MSTTETVLVTDTDVEDAEHTQAVLERAEQLRSDREEDAERPDWLPEGFLTVEDFLNDYNRLRDGNTEETEDEAEEESEDGPEEETEEEDADSSQEQSADLDFEALTSEFFENGSLTDETFERLEEMGIPREVVDTHLAGIQAQAELTRYKVAEAMGGGENLDAVLQWAGQALPEKEIDRINGLIGAGDFDGYMLALDGVKARYEAAFGSLEGAALAGEQVSVADIYQSQEEMKADMRDPRYGKDEAFRNRVAAKVARTRRAS